MGILKDVIEIGDDLGVGKVINDIFGGSSKRKSCGQKERELTALIERLFTPPEIEAMLKHHTFPWTSRRPNITRNRYTAGALAFYTLGGSDCKVNRNDERRFQEYVVGKIEQKEQELQAAKSSGTPTASATATSPSIGFQQNTLGILMVIGLLVGVFALSNS